MNKRIAIVEDEATIRENYSDLFRNQGYTVAAYEDRQQAIKAFSSKLPDLVLLDIGLGDEIEGGYELCRQLRAECATIPIIFLTARDSDLDVISGLRLGADDYLTKDISLQHLAARVAALFRRIEAFQNPPETEKILESGPLTIDSNRFTVHWNNQLLDISLTEFWIIHSLAQYAGHVKSRDQLMQDANIVVDDSTITSHIKRIRRKFLAIDPDFDAIETMYGIGYRWRTR